MLNIAQLFESLVLNLMIKNKEGTSQEDAITHSKSAAKFLKYAQDAFY